MAAVSDHGVLRGPEPAPLGALLVSRGLLSEEQLKDALAEQAAVAQPLGAILVQRGFVRPAMIAQALATQHGGILKSEYGYATGFDVRLAEEAEVKPEPPVSPARSGLGASLRLGNDVGAVRLEAPLQEAGLAIVDADVPVAQPTRIDTLEMELAAAAAENQKLRARLGEQQMEAVRIRSESETFRQQAAVVGARVAGLEAAVAVLQAEKAQLSQ
ncbi:MAG: hypothetical protein ACRDL2_13100 [Gaiellaceae bacterium]